MNRRGFLASILAAGSASPRQGWGSLGPFNHG